MNLEKMIKLFQNELEAANFFSAIYQQQFHYFKKKKIAFELLFDERDLIAALQFLPEKNQSLRLVFNGIEIDQQSLWKNGSLDIARLMQLHSGGSTLIFNKLHQHSNALLYFTKYLASNFSVKVHTNFYATPPSSKGFKPHRDDHDVFAFQVKGSKKWAFYESDKQTNILSPKIHNQKDLVQIEKMELNLGDCMYVPKGVIHAAQSEKEVSWHLTVGLSGYSWSDLLKESIDTIALQHQKLREVVPIDSLSKEQVEAEIQQLFQTVKEKTPAIQKENRFNRDKALREEGMENITLPDPVLLNQLNREMCFQLNQKSRLKVSYRRDAIHFNLPCREMSLAINKRLKTTIQYLQQQNQFKVKEIPALRDEEELLLLVYYLWNNGIIQPVNP